MPRSMRHAKAICFDLDDTLWPVAPVIAGAERSLAEWLAECCPRVTLEHDVVSMRAHRASLAEEHPERCHDLAFLRRESLRRLLTAASYPGELAEEGFAVFQAARNRVDLFADVLPALHRLGGRYRLLALSNGNACLRTIGIGHLFEHSLAAAEAGCAKPDPAMYRQLLERAALDACEVIHVGDDPHADVEGARAVGMHAVWIDRFQRPWPDALEGPASRVGCLNELCELLSP